MKLAPSGGQKACGGEEADQLTGMLPAEENGDDGRHESGNARTRFQSGDGRGETGQIPPPR